MKKILFLIVLFLSIFLFFETSTVSAHSDKNHERCPTPAQSTIYESENPWYSYYGYDYADHYWVSKMVWQPSYTWTDYYGNKYREPGYWWDDGYWRDNGYYRASASCGISFSRTPVNVKYTTGVIDYWNVKASGSPGGASGSTSGTVYWVNKVDVYLSWNGNTYQKDVSNGTTSTSAYINGNPSNSNNSGLVTYSDQNMPTVTCIKHYANGPKGCNVKAVVDKNYNGAKGQRLTCYEYRDPYTNDSDKVCTVRIYVNNVKITSGTTKTYAGKHYNYECLATFADGKQKNISSATKNEQSYVWLSYPSGQNMATFRSGRYIGTQWEKGYKDPRGIYHPPNTLHDFYPVDSESRTYILNCTYYPDYNWTVQHYGSALNRIVYQNGVISDYNSESGSPWNLAKHDKITVNHIGIQKIWVDVTGEFAKYNASSKSTTYEKLTLQSTNNTATFPGGWNLTDKVNGKSYSPSYWNQQQFLVGHWYDFKATIKYNDGTDRDITSAEEVYWDNTPWFKNQSKFTVKNIYDSGMSKTGLDHRIPEHGWNTIDVEYLHQNVPYGKTSYTRTKITNRLKARQLKSLEIKDGSGYAKNPITLINQGQNKKVQYSAWITWTDDVKEDWTSGVRWDGDYLVSPTNLSISLEEWNKHGGGLFDFTPVKGMNQKTTVYADFKDVEDLLGTATRVTDNKGTVQDKSWNSGNYNWDANHDKIEVTINDCSSIDHLASQCPEKTDYWRIHVLNRFNKTGFGTHPNSNFYPDPDYYNVGVWDKENDLYSVQRKFPVSGTSSGVGNQ